jgi:hypothetical protein
VAAATAPTPVAPETAARSTTNTGAPTAAAVVISPEGEVSALPASEPAPVPWTGYGAALLLALAVGAYIWLIRARRAPPGETP